MSTETTTRAESTADPVPAAGPLADLAAAVDGVRRTMRAVEAATDPETRRRNAADFRAALTQLRDITGKAATHLDQPQPQ